MDAMEALAWVPKNRILQGWGDTYTQVINGKEFMEVDGKLWKQAANYQTIEGPDFESLKNACTASSKVFNGLKSSPIGDAVYFHSGNVPLGFFTNSIKDGILTQTTKIGHFTFYAGPQYR